MEESTQGARRSRLLATLREWLAQADDDRRQAPLPEQRLAAEARYRCIVDVLDLVDAVL